jgi:hypothetical protein
MHNGRKSRSRSGWEHGLSVEAPERDADQRGADESRARGRECQAEADRRRPVIGQGHAAGRALKALRPRRNRELLILRIDRTLYLSRGGQV